MIEIHNKRQCCGCEACVQICPKHCISFEEDSEGFRYPNVDVSACVDCGRCEKVCPFNNIGSTYEPEIVYAKQNNNEQDLKHSSSGGIFLLLATKIIAEGGIVFGASFDKNWEVEHTYAETVEDVRKFMGSKYVQSRIGNSYNEVQSFLKKGRKVLFTGTPCQVAGLRNFLGKDFENLLTVDFICHGVPSPLVWRLYLEEVKENARKGENTVSPTLNHSNSEGKTRRNEVSITGISFRDKRLGWKKFSFALTLAKATAEGKKNSVSLSYWHRENPYMLGFLSNLIIRRSCQQCKVKSGRSKSDITIADFWGIQRIRPELDNDKGYSMVILNTKIGHRYGEDLLIDSPKISFKDAIVGNGAYYKSVITHPNQNIFFSKLQKIRDNKNIKGYTVINLLENLSSLPLSYKIRRKIESEIQEFWSKIR